MGRGRERDDKKENGSEIERVREGETVGGRDKLRRGNGVSDKRRERTKISNIRES